MRNRERTYEEAEEGESERENETQSGRETSERENETQSGRETERQR